MKENRVGQPTTIGEITIIPLEEICLYCDKSEDRIWVYAFKQPIGVVIISPQFKHVLDIQGEELDLNTCIQDFEGLQRVIDNLDNSNGANTTSS